MGKIKELLGETRNVIIAITAILGFIGTISAGIFSIDDRYAKADVVQQLEERVTLSELKDQLQAALEEYHFLKKQSRKYPDDREIADELHDAKEVVDNIKEKIKAFGN